MKTNDVEILVIGAGMAGLATAYYLAVEHKRSRLLIVDEGQPMALTSAQSGENYRNWWPHPTMAAFTDHSTDLMEDIARRTDNRIHMTRRGYLLVTRDDTPDELLRQLHAGYGAAASQLIGTSPNRRQLLIESTREANPQLPHFLFHQHERLFEQLVNVDPVDLTRTARKTEHLPDDVRNSLGFFPGNLQKARVLVTLAAQLHQIKRVLDRFERVIHFVRD